MNALPEIGTKIWREVRVAWGKTTVVDIEFIETDKGSIMMKAYQPNFGPLSGSDEWVACQPKGTGVVCFCHVDIPDDWTYFEVRGHSNSGNCVFVNPVAGSREELIAIYE